MTDLKQKTEHFLALADAATPGPWAAHPSRAVVVPSPHASRPIGCHENPVIDRETYAQEICALHWPDRNRNESEVRSNANLIASAPDMATHIRALQAENDRLRDECEALRVDAGRYRWLRGDGGPASIRWPRWEVKHWSSVWNPVQKQDMDEAIDAAMRGDQKS